MIRIKALLLSLVLLLAAVPALCATSPREQVQKTVDTILETLADKSLTPDARDEKIEQIVRDRFDFQSMSQWILGVHWRKATPEQRQKFIDLFTQLLETTYRGRMTEYANQYSGERVEIVSERIIDNRALVDTVVITQEQKRVPISYKLALDQETWKAYDVVIEEVSLVNTYRAEYADILRREGFDGLFSRMEKRIAELKAGKTES